MQKQIHKEIKELKIAIAKVIGLPEMDEQEPFSEEALNNATKELQKLSVERGEWVEDGHSCIPFSSRIYHQSTYHCCMNGTVIRE
jgi:hypothetical protein